MSWLSKYVFDPIKTVFARSATSSNPATAAMGAAGIAAVHDISISAGAVASAAFTGSLTPNSAIGVGNALVGKLEDDLRLGVDAALVGLLGEVPVVGALVAPEAVALANTGLAFLESHVHDYIASLFHHAKTAVVPPSA